MTQRDKERKSASRQRRKESNIFGNQSVTWTWTKTKKKINQYILQSVSDLENPWGLLVLPSRIHNPSCQPFNGDDFNGQIKCKKIHQMGIGDWSDFCKEAMTG